ncbi:MAG: hypothetical protein JO344_19150 [Planctomycetaceae bacterium]|nr:hypothetical protein [Planctomycetaceae bacterium]
MTAQQAREQASTGRAGGSTWRITAAGSWITSSGTLCVDELHLGQMTLLLATDPLNDLPVAFALVARNDQPHRAETGTRARRRRYSSVVSAPASLRPSSRHLRAMRYRASAESRSLVESVSASSCARWRTALRIKRTCTRNRRQDLHAKT